jgi:hypothetical protein
MNFDNLNLSRDEQWGTESSDQFTLEHNNKEPESLLAPGAVLVPLLLSSDFIDLIQPHHARSHADQTDHQNDNQKGWHECFLACRCDKRGPERSPVLPEVPKPRQYSTGKK